MNGEDTELEVPRSSRTNRRGVSTTSRAWINLIGVKARLALVVVVLVAASPASGRVPPPLITFVPEPVLAAMAGERVRVAVSPDGRHVYFLGGLDYRTGIAIVTRDSATGALSQAPGPEGCLQAWIAKTNCRKGPAFNNSKAMAVAPDGRDVAVGGYAVSQVALYGPTPRGGLALRSCVGESAGATCGTVRGMGRTADLAFSPDGRYLYVAIGLVSSGGGILVLQRQAATGTLQQLDGADGCLQRTGILFPAAPPCGSVPATGFQPAYLRISPDGSTVLVASLSTFNQGFFVFARDQLTGVLTLRTCYTDAPMPPCTAPPGPAGAGTADLAGGISNLAFTPDGRTVVAVGQFWGTNHHGVYAGIYLFHLDPATGALTLAACYEAQTSGCNALVPVPSAAASVAISSDGRTVYVGGGSLRAYSLSTTGLTAIGDCVGRGKGCTPIPLKWFSDIFSLALSPDGRWLYGAGNYGLAFRVG